MTTTERANHCRQIGTLGGIKTAATYGKKYMQTIGANGFKTTCQRHYGGNPALARAALMERGRMRPVRRIDPAADLRHDLDLAA